MMVERVAAKQAAKSQLAGNWGPAVLAFFILEVAMIGVSIISSLTIIGFVVQIALIGIAPFGMAFYALKYANNEERELGDVFAAFNNFKTTFCLTFLIGLYTFLWSLLFLVPGIVKSYSYSMAYYILAENPGITASEAIRRSKEMTDGHKLDLFVTDLSFMGWCILASLTLGIGYLWLIPYKSITAANIYNQIKGNNVEVNFEK